MTGSATNSGAVGRPVSQYPKQAVIVIHGIGEQVPMDSIRGFVRAVWETDDAVLNENDADPDEVWSRPDLRTGSLELRRITTNKANDRPPPISTSRIGPIFTQARLGTTSKAGSLACC
jgi:hypothetical protein